jgi:UDP-glucose 4-epimerase
LEQLMGAVLVLGAGQVGTFAARRLAEDGADVVAADVLPAAGFFARFGPLEAELAVADLLDPVVITALIRRHRVAVVVVAAGLDAESCRRDPATAWRVNARGPALAAAAALAGGASRLVLVSSFAVYGRSACGPIAETAPLAARSVYGRSKAAAEAAVLKLARSRLDVRIVRPCSVYGPSRPGFGSQATRVLDQVLLAVMGGQTAPSPAMFVAEEEYIYVKDLARALSLVALGSRLPRYIVFNVGAGATTDADSLRKAIERALPGRRIPLAPPASPADGRRFPLDVSRVREALAFEPSFDLAHGLSDYLGMVTVP